MSTATSNIFELYFAIIDSLVTFSFHSHMRNIVSPIR